MVGMFSTFIFTYMHPFILGYIYINPYMSKYIYIYIYIAPYMLGGALELVSSYITSLNGWDISLPLWLGSYLD